MFYSLEKKDFNANLFALFFIHIALKIKNHSPKTALYYMCDMTLGSLGQEKSAEQTLQASTPRIERARSAIQFGKIENRN